KAEVENKTPVVLLGEPSWRNQFGASESVLGQTISIDEKVYTIIGVAPRGLRLPRLRESPTDLWLPLDLRSDDYGFTLVGRLRPGVDQGTAARELDTLVAHSPAFSPTMGRFRAKLIAPSEMVSFRDSLMMLTVAVGLVLLIAC